MVWGLVFLLLFFCFVFLFFVVFFVVVFFFGGGYSFVCFVGGLFVCLVGWLVVFIDVILMGSTEFKIKRTLLFIINA